MSTNGLKTELFLPTIGDSVGGLGRLCPMFSVLSSEEKQYQGCPPTDE